LFFDAALWCAIRDSRLSGAERYLWTLTVFGYHQVAAGRTAITRQTADRPPGTISTLPPLADSPKCYMTHRWTERDSNPQSPTTVSAVRQLLPVVSGASASPIPFCGPALFGVDESSRAGVRARPLARPLWLGRRLGDDGRHTFGIDVESEEDQWLVAGVAPLVDEAEGLVDQ